MSQAVSLDDDVCRTFDLRVGAGTGFWGVSGFIGTAGRLDLSATGMYITILIPCAVDGPTACCVFATFVFVSVCWGCVTLLVSGSGEFWRATTTLSACVTSWRG